MKTMEELLEVAVALENQGEKEEALSTLSQAFDMLIEQSADYARAQESDTTDIEALRARKDALLEHSSTFLRTSLTASMILNNMGLLFMELGQLDAAEQKFEEAVRLTPTDETFEDARENLQIVRIKIAEQNTTEQPLDE